MLFSQGFAGAAVFTFFLFTAGMAVIFTVAFGLGLYTDAIRIESNWGGLGGGVGGWSLSRPLACFIAAVGFTVAAVTLAGSAAASLPERLKEKYAPVSRLLDQEHAKLLHYDVRDRKLFLQAAVPTVAAKDRVWNEIKLINPSQDDIIADITAAAAAAVQ